MESLFEVPVSESQLRGEGEAAAAADKPATVDIVVSDRPAEAATESEPLGPETTGVKEAKPAATDGATEVAALKANSRLLAEEIVGLRRQLEEAKKGKPATTKEDDGSDEEAEEQDDEGGFQVLTDEEYEELVEEDPTEALKYMNRLRSHEKGLEQAKAKGQELDGKVMAAGKRMAATVPGLFDKDQKVATDLTQFAVDHGLKHESLVILTDPGTMVQIRDEKGRFKGVMPLGDAAADLTELIYRLHSKTGGGTKAGAAKAETKPRAADSKKDVSISASDEEKKFAAMSEEEQRKYLGG